jgi:hypothetical protein
MTANTIFYKPQIKSNKKGMSFETFLFYLSMYNHLHFIGLIKSFQRHSFF